MPTYEYQCTACGHTFELFQSIKAAPIKKCPACGKSKAKRLIGMGAGLLFKGSGFYITDYRGDAYTKAAKADAPASTPDAKPAADTPAAASKSESNTPAQSESKSEPKTQPKSEPKPPAPTKENKARRKS